MAQIKAAQSVRNLGTVGTKIDFSGFEPCPPRSNNEHRQEAQDILNQTSAGDCSNLEQKYGTRYTELMLLPYFDCVRFHIIDPMHNLFTGTTKHIMKNVWLDSEKNLEKIQEKMKKTNLKFQPVWGGCPKEN